MGSPDIDFFFLKMDWVGAAGLRAMGDGREGMAGVLDNRHGSKRMRERKKQEQPGTMTAAEGRRCRPRARIY